MIIEAVIVTTYRRPELLYCCLKRIREIEPWIPIYVFPDRTSVNDKELAPVVDAFRQNVQWNLVPDHDFHGNSYNTMEAFRMVYNNDHGLVYYVEDDVMVHADFFKWHRAQHELWPRIFGTMAWIFNRHAPIVDDVLFQPWYYAIGSCFKREKLKLIAEHATPRYYEDMAGYVGKHFGDTPLNKRPFGVEHFEQDGLIQRILDRDKTQTISPGIAKCSHVGMYGYNRGWNTGIDLFAGLEKFDDRVARLETFIADPYERAEMFGRDIVEREIGRELPKRELRYKVKHPFGWETEYVSERVLNPKNLPSRVNSVRVTEETTFDLIKNVVSS